MEIVIIIGALFVLVGVMATLVAYDAKKIRPVAIEPVDTIEKRPAVRVTTKVAKQVKKPTTKKPTLKPAQKRKSK